MSAIHALKKAMRGGTASVPRLDQSARFDSAGDQHLMRAIGSSDTMPTARTWSIWVKRTKIGGIHAIFGVDTNEDVLFFDSDDRVNLQLDGGAGAHVAWTPRLRDTHGWYHLVLTLQTGAVTASDRVKLMINGVEAETAGAPAWPAIRYGLVAWGATGKTNYVNRFRSSASYYGDHYLADVVDVANAVLPATNFGEFDGNGLWRYRGGPLSLNGAGPDLVADDPGVIEGNVSSGAGDWADSDTGAHTLFGAAGTHAGASFAGYDLGSAKELRAIEMRQALSLGVNHQISEALIQYSDNGATWTTAETWSSLIESQIIHFHGHGAHRYWRVMANSGAKGGPAFEWQLSEMRFHAYDTVGANTFRLDFAASDDLGHDVSGNGNDFTPAGSPARSADSPTKNHAVFSIVHPNRSMAYSRNATVAQGPSIGYRIVPSTIYVPVGVDLIVYAEIQIEVGISSGGPGVGIVERSFSQWTTNHATAGVGIVFYDGGSGGVLANGKFGSYGDAYGESSTIGIFFNAKAGAVWFSKDGTLQNGATEAEIVAGSTGNAAATGLTGAWTFGAGDRTDIYSVRFGLDAGQEGFANAPGEPVIKEWSGFNVYNALVAADAVTRPSSHFDVLIWAGDDSTSRTLSGLNFQPEMVVLKNRGRTLPWWLYDEKRGFGVGLQPDGTASEASNSSDGYLSAFTNGGFEVKTGDNSNANTNNGGSDYVAYCFKIAQGFFDIVLDDGSSEAKEISHSLTVTPNLILRKERDGTTDWYVYHSTYGVSDPETDYWVLSTSQDVKDFAGIWDDRAPSAADFSVGDDVDLNQTGNRYVTYLWAEKPGLCTVGFYTGNGAIDGPIVPLGFKPRFLMIKGAASGRDWHVYDTARSPQNPVNLTLYMDQAAAEFATAIGDWLCNGFKIRTNSSDLNANAGVYQFIAFAEDARQLLAV